MSHFKHCLRPENPLGRSCPPPPGLLSSSVYRLYKQFTTKKP